MKDRLRLTLCEGAAFDDSGSFADGVELAGGEAGAFFFGAAGPEDFEVGGSSGAEAEVQARVVDGDVAALAGEHLRLNFAAVVGEDARANGAAIALCAFEANF